MADETQAARDAATQTASTHEATEPKVSAKDRKAATETGGKFVPVEEAAEAGYFGTRKTAHPDEAYSLRSGPDAPTGELGAE
jgi:hypothetical protein